MSEQLKADFADLERAETLVFRRYSEDEVDNAEALGGRTLRRDAAATPGGFRSMRLFGDAGNAWSALPRPAAEVWARVGDVLDAVRLLHNERIEWLSLLATLWLRACIVASAPVLARWPGAGEVPGVPPTSVSDWVWVFAVAWAGSTALLAPWVVARAEDPRRADYRLALLMLELPLCVALIALVPSWATAVFSVGVVNWAQRPNWRSSVLVAYCIGLAGGLWCSLFAHGASVDLIAPEIAMALAACLLVSCSYGLIFPITLTALLSIPMRRLRSRFRASREGRAVAMAALQVLDTADKGLDSCASEVRNEFDEDYAREALARARADVAEEAAVLRSPWRRPVELQDALSDAVWGVLPKVDPERRERPCAYTPEVVPQGLARARLSRRGSRCVSRLAKRAALEAARHGMGPLRTDARLTEDQAGVEVIFTNRCDPGRTRGRGTGAQGIVDSARRLPGGRVIEHREREAPAGIFASGQVMILRVRFDLAAFRREGIEDVAGGKR